MKIIIEKLVSGGDGMGRIKGKIVFVPLTLPGETHDIEITEEKKGYSRGESRELVDGDSFPYKRREPFCPLYGHCGGCNLQHISYEDQLTVKEEIALDHYRRLGGIFQEPDGADIPEMVPSPERGYRNRIQLHYREGILGFNQRRSHDLVPIKSCPLLVEGINDYLNSPSRDEKALKERFTIFGTEDSSWVEGRDERVEITVSGRPFSFSPSLFFQSNLSLVPPLLDRVCRFAGRGEHFLDLYSGVGLFAAFLEDSFLSGTAVESARGALAFGRRNLKKTEYFEKTVEVWARGKRKSALDFAVVDPPRTGLSKDTVKILGELKPARLAYVSCNPVTHARDLKLLIQRGFRLEKISLFDFYPQTSHLESLALLNYGG